MVGWRPAQGGGGQVRGQGVLYGGAWGLKFPIRNKPML